jgi:lambda family phage tail tape measure protein
LAGVYDQQIAKIVQTAQVDADRIAKSVEGLQGLRLVEKGRLQDIENTTKAIESQISRQQALGDIIRGANQQAAEVRGATPSSQLTGLSSIQRQIVEIQDSARKAAIEAARSFAANFEDNGDGLTPESAQELAAGLDQIAESYKRLADEQISFASNNYETSRTFTTGWADAFAEYAESASNSAKQAQMYFETFTGGMEDAMVNFAKTGKLSFKDLANSIIADLIRIQTRKMIVSAMSGGLGGIVSGIGSLFGFAAGGATDTSPMIVGERGPELFITNSAGRIIPNNQLGNNQPQQMITNVTYSIQAVDASSFRQLVARDPQFIYSVTEKGRRSVPTRR